MNDFQKELKERKQQNLFRQLPKLDDGIDFYSNDYLGLSRSQELSQLISHKSKILNKNGSTGSRLLSGNSNYILDVERSIADFHQKESALIYGSGYTANLGLLSSLGKKGTNFIMDELAHASLIDGARLGYANRIRFKHNHLEDLEKKLRSSKGNKFVIIESVYSMDGDVSPVEEIAKLCESHNALLIVDEAHGIGVLGENGGGMIEKMNVGEKVFAQIMTYGKAPGIHGAAVVGPAWLKDYQINFSRPFIFSTAPSPHQIASIEAFYELIPSRNSERVLLKNVVDYFCSKRTEHGGDWLESNTQIQSLIVPGNDRAIQLGIQLKEAGINALPIRKPSVAEGTERIRFCLHAYNTNEEIDHLFDVL